jgi:hypothetical protein
VTYPAPINPDPDTDYELDPDLTEQLPDDLPEDGETAQPVQNPPPAE